MYLTIDIETIPTQNEEIKQSVARKLKAPANYKKQETIDKYISDHKDEAILKTSFNGLAGEIICIGFAIDDDPVLSISRGVGESERDLLFDFWARILLLIGNDNPTWIGHNLCEFDLRFLWQRSVINNVKPTTTLPYNSNPWGRDVVDTLYEVMGKNKAGGSLNAIALALGLGQKTEGMSGADVWPEFQKGNIEKIAEYCRQDVHLTREIYKRINFIDSVVDLYRPDYLP